MIQACEKEPAIDAGAAVSSGWPKGIYEILKAACVEHLAYVPDAGHSELIRLLEADPAITANVLTTEEEGIAIAAGAWLGGMRSVLLMQSSGVGNCINMLSLPIMMRSPLLMLVTMRGEWAEFNPWQAPMGRGTEAALASVGVQTIRADHEGDVVDAVSSAAALAYQADQQVAVLLGQRLLGRKKW